MSIQTEAIAAEERWHARERRFALAMIVLDVGFIGFCLLLGKTDVAEMLLWSSAAFAGGYGLGRVEAYRCSRGRRAPARSAR